MMNQIFLVWLMKIENTDQDNGHKLSVQIKEDTGRIDDPYA